MPSIEAPPRHPLLAEELFLLGTKPEGGIRMAARSSLGSALRAAILAELAARGQISVHQEDVMVEPDRPPSRDGLLDEARSTIERVGDGRSVGYWVTSLTPAYGTWLGRLGERLQHRGILDAPRWSPFGTVFPRHEERRVTETADRLRAALAQDRAPDGRTLVLLSLVNACGLVGTLVPRGERRAARRRAKELTSEEVVGAHI